MAIAITVALVVDGSQVRKCVTPLVGSGERRSQVISE